MKTSIIPVVPASSVSSCLMGLCLLVLLVASSTIERAHAEREKGQQEATAVDYKDAVDGGRWFAYVKSTSSEDPEKNRTHVFALTTATDLTDRFINLLEKIRESRDEEIRQKLALMTSSSGSATTTSDDGESEEDLVRTIGKPCRYNAVLKFPTIEDRFPLVDKLYEIIVEYNRVATSFFTEPHSDDPTEASSSSDSSSSDPVVPPGILMKLDEVFGASFDKEHNRKYPTQTQLNSIHDQMAENFDVETARHLKGIPEHVEMVDGAQFGKSVSRIRYIEALRLLSDINEYVHKVEALSEASLRNRFTFNILQYRDECFAHQFLITEMLKEEEYFLDDFWEIQLQHGGLYLAYPHVGKNLLNVMNDDDLSLLRNNETRESQILFTDHFRPNMYLVWSLENKTEAEASERFRKWWMDNEITEKYGYEFGNPREPNGFIRFGKQVCDPPSDCDRMWSELMDEFAQTPVVTDVFLSQERPYGKTDDDLRFLYPSKEMMESWKHQVQNSNVEWQVGDDEL